MPGPVTDPRAAALRGRYVARFGGAEPPVPVERIAEDLLGLSVAESEKLHVSGEGRQLEREANVFAAELLVPEPLVRQHLSRDESTGGLAATFGVSSEAIAWRLYNFGLTDRRPDA
jgi:hypothetical protein